jgi:hypothetical protein
MILDALLWCYEKSGVYSSHSYAIINFKGVTLMYIPPVWGIRIPPKIKLFLWLLAHNKLATIDNLNRKGMHKPEECMFCKENESIAHLFFECVVAKATWAYVYEFLGIDICADFISVATRWISKQKSYVVNIISTTVLRGLWLTRNDFVFEKQGWRDVKTVLRRILKLTLEWEPICKESKLEEMRKWSSFLVQAIQEPLKIGRE